MAEYERVKQPFEPVYNKDSRILILGSMTSTSHANAAYSLDKLMSKWTVIKG